MKQKLLLFLSVFALLASGCIKNEPDLPPPPLPSGTFTGTFKMLHRHTDKVPYDSLSTNLTLTLQSATNTFAVTGDTTAVHAGSFGTFAIYSQFIAFADKTYSATVVSPKMHLDGTYIYNFDGINLTVEATSSDTLAVGYFLKKTGN
jgi:hypothetical protein